MKRILFVLFLVPTLAGADSVEWATYCDAAGVERVRASLTVYLGDAYFNDDTYAAIFIYNNDQCIESDFWAHGRDPAPESLGDGNYRYVWDGFLRSGFLVEHPSSFGEIFFLTQEPGEELVLRLQHFYCGDPQAIVDTSECVPLPAVSSTWGAIKALYRDSEGSLP